MKLSILSMDPDRGQDRYICFCSILDANGSLPMLGLICETKT